MKEFTYETQLNNKRFSIKTGKLAKQASGAAVVQYGETIVMVTVVAAEDPKEDAAFLPLSVEYQEKIYAAGRIPGNYFRREMGRPSEKETLTCRLIDRPVRPLFPDGYAYETQIIATVLSMDKENEPDVLAIVGASAALEISDLPFEGPIAAIRVGRQNGRFIANPTSSEQEESDMNIVVAGSKTGVVMVEGGSSGVSEADMLEAIFFGHEAMQPILGIQEQMKTQCGKPKRVVPPPEKDADLEKKIETQAAEAIHEALLQSSGKINRKKALSAVRERLYEDLGENYAERKGEIKELFGDLVKKISRDIVLNENKRIDGRAFNEIRPIECEVGVLPRTHGSALFTRGETQVMGVMTLGSGQDEQRIETLGGDETRPFMLHYNFPPYSVGETKRMLGPSRRDIGHGNLAHRAIINVLPEREDFDYTIRLVSEVLESNGSSSMGTVCSCILALMDGGVQIKAPVSGIAMGLVKEGDNVVVLSDILGDEDHFGDMDFKVTGTEDGITALQMDIKIKELTREIMGKALEQAREGRLHILGKMLEALTESREEISPHAPRIYLVQISPDKIREIIGPGGKMIRELQAETNTRIEVDDSGIVKIAAEIEEDARRAVAAVEEIGKIPEAGEIYDGKVVKITDFGAFIQIKNGTDGLCHISELDHNHVKNVTDVINVGDIVRVKVLEVGNDGKIRLSRKALIAKPENAGQDDNKSKQNTPNQNKRGNGPRRRRNE
ncbi:MAG: polyribonucleotide nucleotidyltransferase [Thermodesulfobacteriota bacterium]|nr:polyribonucleotide nucleotidyltransferase [Thermodesulfobacteriota bacterium]